MKKMFLINRWLLLFTVVICFGLTSCSTDDVTDNSSIVSNDLTGKWNFNDVDLNNVGYTGDWTFNNDGTMVIHDKMDLLNGQILKYTYNSATKQLSSSGLVRQIKWKSKAQFTLDNWPIVYTKQ